MGGGSGNVAHGFAKNCVRAPALCRRVGPAFRTTPTDARGWVQLFEPRPQMCAGGPSSPGHAHRCACVGQALRTTPAGRVHLFCLAFLKQLVGPPAPAYHSGPVRGLPHGCLWGGSSTVDGHSTVYRVVACGAGSRRHAGSRSSWVPTMAPTHAWCWELVGNSSRVPNGPFPVVV